MKYRRRTMSAAWGALRLAVRIVGVLCISGSPLHGGYEQTHVSLNVRDRKIHLVMRQCIV